MPSGAFPKTARLLTSADFRFRPYFRHHSEYFTFVFSPRGKGRLGVSLSKKVLRRATSRNRVRRLVREVFRLQRSRFQNYDLHLVGRPPLTQQWRQLGRSHLEQEFEGFLKASGDRKQLHS